MISMATPRAQWGAAFGVHRALDMAGAMMGPVLAFTVLAAAPGGYDAVFVVSLCAGLIGLGVVVVYVPHPDRPARPGDGPAVSLRAAVHLVRVPGLRTVLLAATLLGLTTLGDGFVYLALQDQLGFDVAFQEMFSTLTSGGTLVLIGESLRQDLPALARWVDEAADEAAIERLFVPYIALSASTITEPVGRDGPRRRGAAASRRGGRA